jgi:FkbM family methyltransferase
MRHAGDVIKGQMHMRKWRLGFIEVLMIVAGVAFVSHAYGRGQTVKAVTPFLSTANIEAAALEKKYGPDRNSDVGEEWIVRDFFQDRRNGVFLDVGANHYRNGSNTYFLETALGWSGIAVEPQGQFAADYATYRPHTVFVPLFAASRPNERALLYVPDNNAMASFDRRFATEGGTNVTTMETRTTTLDAILEGHQVTRVDFMSMDIELAEPAALAGFSPERFGLQLAAVEGHAEVRQQIIDYFAEKRFAIVGRYLRADNRNLWFAPLRRGDPASSVR